MTDKAKRTALFEPDLKSLRALHSRYGAELIEAELSRIETGQPAVRGAGAPERIHPMSYVAVYLDIEERKAMKDGKARRLVLSVSKACEELAEVLNTVTVDVRYAGKSLQAMYRKGLKLRTHDPVHPAALITTILRNGRQVSLPFISTEIRPDGEIRGPMIDGLGQGGRD